jgi:chromosomal replication initiation ATPase DnaA
MPLSLKSLLTEHKLQKNLRLLDENIVHDIMMLVLSPKVKKAMKTLKKDPEFIELERQIKRSKEEMEMIAKRIERNMEKRQGYINDLKKAGVKVDINMTSNQAYEAFKKWQAADSERVGKSEWSKYFK